MVDRRLGVQGLLPLLLLTPVTIAQQGAPADLPSSLVRQALAAELRAAKDTAHPMRYRLFKSTPRLSSLKEICETKDGSVARLLEINGHPLNSVDEQKEQGRLDSLLSDPGRQRHRKQSEDQDASRALEVLRALPTAFVYTYAGSGDASIGHVEKFTFKPNPGFDPPNLETQVLTEMTGELWVDPAHERVTRLEGHLQHDVAFGWGILGRLNKGGWIIIEQSDVGDGQWRVVRFQMAMSGRVLFKTRSFDTTEEESRFESVPLGMGYAEAIRLLRGDAATEHAGR
ncbi:MAG TPA: hypothetical protein VKR52_00150 [Terracidiphilus sp.]|nr:hypothetical protein [Terracidiphilus sp.]